MSDNKIATEASIKEFVESADQRGKVARAEEIVLLYLILQEIKNLVSVNLTTDKAQVVYENELIVYVCEASIGITKSTAAWKIRKIDNISGMVITWADGNANYDNVATDLATVEALNFS
jgi:hypothetical protein